MCSRLDKMEKQLPNLQPPVKIFTTVTTPTRTLNDLTNHPRVLPAINTPPSKAASISSTPSSKDASTPSSTPSSKAASISSTPSSEDGSTSSSTPSVTATSVTTSLLKKILADKTKNPLPAINRSILLEPEDVVEKYPKLMTISKIPTLAVRLSKEAYFGKEIMALCTVRGTGTYHALPENDLSKLKLFLFHQSHPRLTGTRVEFEHTWKACVESIGQACKALRTSKK